MKLQLKTTIRRVLAGVALMAAGAAQASYITAIDSFTITRNGITIFADQFSDGIAPTTGSVPGGPGAVGTATYGVPFAGGQTETGGKLFMNSSLGGYTLAGDGTARLRNIDVAATNADPLSPQGLKQGAAFEVNGLFDLVATPDARDLYGIALINRTSPGQATGQVWSLDIGRSAGGVLGVHLILQDYTANTITLIASASLDTSHDQVMLQFDHDASSATAHASFQYWDGGVANGGFIDVADTAVFPFAGWLRGEFHTNQQTAVIPAPATAWLLLAGLGLFGFTRRRKA